MHVDPKFILCAWTLGALTSLSTSAVEPDLKKKIDARLGEITLLAADPNVVAAVKAQNAAPTEEVQAMTQEKWENLKILDPFVRAMTKNPAAEALKAGKSGIVSEAFVSSADGKKVAFLTKPTNWSHADPPKHQTPMAGKIWYGEVEVDESSGFQQVQVAVPVLDGEKPIGSLVVGIKVSRL